MTPREQTTQGPKLVLTCTDIQCTVKGALCCLACNQSHEKCPGRCPTVERYTDPEYPGCPYQKQEITP